MQPDGDLVVNLRREAGDDAWQQHADEVGAWLRGLQERITRIARRVGAVRALVLGVLPALAGALLLAGDAPAVEADATAGAALAAGAVTLLDEVPGLARLVAVLRSSRAYVVAVGALPPVLAAASLWLHGDRAAALLPLVGPVLALAVLAGARWALRRVAL